MESPIGRACPQLSGAKLSGPEKAFVKVLQQRMADGELIWWAEHPINLRLGERLRYEPDFVAVLADGTMVVYEVKASSGFAGTRFNGGSTGSGGTSRAKFLTSVEAFPMFRFVLARQLKKKDGGGFEETVHIPRRGYGHCAVGERRSAGHVHDFGDGSDTCFGCGHVQEAEPCL